MNAHQIMKELLWMLTVVAQYVYVRYVILLTTIGSQTLKI